MDDLIKYLNTSPYKYKISNNNGKRQIVIDIDETISANSTAKYDNIKDLRAATKMTQQSFGDYFGISIRNIQDWEANAHSCKPYLINLMEFKLRKNEVIK